MAGLLDFVMQRLSPHMKTIGIVVSLLVVVGVFYYVYRYIYLPKKNAQKMSDVANAEPNGKTITIFMFHVNWCPHCKTALPEWNMFKDEYNQQLVNGYIIECIDTDCTENKKPEIATLLEKYKVEYFPTVKGVMIGPNGQNMTVDYNAKVNRSNLGQFVISLSESS
jgi:thiol-disulfide isomerase/thioredoxin